jgi:hypothetical protein
MILPAGGLATSVRDLSLFIRMWPSGRAPKVNGRLLLKPATIKSANLSMFSLTTPGPAYCKAGVADANKFYYSPCGQAYGFGVTWYVGQQPYLQHNGDEPGLSGSNTVVDQPGLIAATGLISTEPYPKAPGLDSNFMETQVFGLLTAGKTGDAATTWSGVPLADGTARLLWLSGAEPPPGVAGPVKIPGPVPTVHSNPKDISKIPPGYIAIAHWMMEPIARPEYQNSLLAMFSPGFRAQNGLADSTIESFLNNLFGTAPELLNVPSS